MSERWRRLASPWCAVALGVLLVLPSLAGGLAVDDHIHRVAVHGHEAFPGTPRSVFDLFGFLDGNEETTRALNNRILGLWMVQDDIRVAFLRPLSSLTHAFDHLVWPDHPWAMHLQNIAWYALLVWAAGVALRRMLGAGAAAVVALLLFAIDDNHGMPVGWISNRNTLIASVFGVMALVAYDKARRDDWRPGVWAAPLCFALALLSAEAGVAAGGYIVAHALFMSRDSWQARVRSLVPFALVAAAWRVAYAALGRGASGTDLYIDPAANPLAFAQAIVAHLPILLLGQFLPVPAEIWAGLSSAGQAWLAVIGGAAVTAIGLLVWPLIRSDARTRFWIVGALLAAIPACATFPNDRLLVLTGIGGAVLVAQVLTAVWTSGAGWFGPSRSRPVLVLAVAWTLTHAVIAPVLLPARSLVFMFLERTIAGASDSLPTDQVFTSQQLVIVNAPDPFLSVYALVRRASLAGPVPASVRVLSMTDAAVAVTRADARTLILDLESGMMRRPVDVMLRSRNLRFRVGDVVALEGFTAEILAVDSDGPRQVRFRFARSLDDPALRWVAWRGRRYESFALPLVGETVRVANRGEPLAAFRD